MKKGGLSSVYRVILPFIFNTFHALAVVDSPPGTKISSDHTFDDRPHPQHIAPQPPGEPEKRPSSMHHTCFDQSLCTPSSSDFMVRKMRAVIIETRFPFSFLSKSLKAREIAAALPAASPRPV